MPHILTPRSPTPQGKKVLLRCDLNVPLDGTNITDDTRIRASLPTIEYLTSNGARVFACSHLGRPKDGPDPSLSLAPVAVRLGELLKKVRSYLITQLLATNKKNKKNAILTR